MLSEAGCAGQKAIVLLGGPWSGQTYYCWTCPICTPWSCLPGRQASSDPLDHRYVGDRRPRLANLKAWKAALDSLVTSQYGMPSSKLAKSWSWAYAYRLVTSSTRNSKQPLVLSYWLCLKGFSADCTSAFQLCNTCLASLLAHPFGACSHWHMSFGCTVWHTSVVVIQENQSASTAKLLITIILYYTILYYTIRYYTILYYTLLYYTILYYIILYYIILFHYMVYPQMVNVQLRAHSILRSYYIAINSQTLWHTWPQVVQGVLCVWAVGKVNEDVLCL